MPKYIAYLQFLSHFLLLLLLARSLFHKFYKIHGPIFRLSQQLFRRQFLAPTKSTFLSDFSICICYTHTHVKKFPADTHTRTGCPDSIPFPFVSHLGKLSTFWPHRLWQSICSNKLNYVACSQRSLSLSPSLFFWPALCHCLHSFSPKYVAENPVGNSFCRLLQKANQIASHVTCLMASFNGL